MTALSCSTPGHSKVRSKGTLLHTISCDLWCTFGTVNNNRGLKHTLHLIGARHSGRQEEPGLMLDSVTDGICIDSSSKGPQAGDSDSIQAQNDLVNCVTGGFEMPVLPNSLEEGDTRLSVLLADDHLRVLASAMNLLGSGYRIVDAVSDGRISLCWISRCRRSTAFGPHRRSAVWA